jgi:hypothetical protein
VADHLPPSSIERDRSGRWLPGHKSTGGRPKGLVAHAREVLRGEGTEVVDFLTYVMRGHIPTVSVDGQLLLDPAGNPVTTSAPLRNRMQAAVELLDRGLMPRQQVEAHMKIEAPTDINPDALTVEEARLYMEMRRKMHRGHSTRAGQETDSDVQDAEFTDE